MVLNRDMRKTLRSKKAIISLVAFCYLVVIWVLQFNSNNKSGSAPKLKGQLEQTLQGIYVTGTFQHYSEISTNGNQEQTSSPMPEGGVATWEQEQERRKGVVRRTCENLGLNQNKSLDLLVEITGKSSNFLVDEERKAIYCYIPKVACTNWKKVWMALTGLTKEKNLTAIPLMPPHNLTNKMGLLNTTKNKSELRNKLKTYKKIIAVRHPFQRLLSAYRDKIHKKMGDPSFQGHVFPFVIKRRSNANLTNIQWPEFVDFVVSRNGKNSNEHWRSYMALCHPCAINYDVIAKSETLIEDAERFLRLIAAPEDLHFPTSSRTSRRINDSLWKEYKNQLTADQLANLHKAYEEDFRLFDYN